MDDARADLFKDGLMVIGIPEGTSKETVDLVGTLARLLEMRVMFSEPVEMDGFQSAAHYLPPNAHNHPHQCCRKSSRLAGCPKIGQCSIHDPSQFRTNVTGRSYLQVLSGWQKKITSSVISISSHRSCWNFVQRLKSDEAQLLAERVNFAKEILFQSSQTENEGQSGRQWTGEDPFSFVRRSIARPLHVRKKEIRTIWEPGVRQLIIVISSSAWIRHTTPVGRPILNAGPNSIIRVRRQIYPHPPSCHPCLSGRAAGQK